MVEFIGYLAQIDFDLSRGAIAALQHHDSKKLVLGVEVIPNMSMAVADDRRRSIPTRNLTAIKIYVAGLFSDSPMN
eukprot:2728039-Amphidinium_carterae.1